MNLKTLHLKTIISFFAFFFLVGQLSAQDLHYSMFNRSPFNISPGLVGVFGGDIRASANYRREWKKVSVDYQTFTAAVEHKLFLPKIKRGFLTGGLHFNYDDAGALSLASTQIGLSGSYVFPLSKSLGNKHFLSGGLQLGFSQRRFNADNLRVDLQYNNGEGSGYDPNLPHQENLLNESISFANFSGGLNYRFQNTEEGKRTRLDIGGAIYHLNRPDKNFDENQSAKLDRRFSIYGMNAFRVSEDWDLGLLATGQFQGEYQEIVVGLNVKTYSLNKVNLLAGLSYRFGDAFIPNINLDYQNLSFGFSYDLNVSEFDIATNRRGGPEFSLIYTMGKPRLKVHKPCPIF